MSHFHLLSYTYCSILQHTVICYNILSIIIFYILYYSMLQYMRIVYNIIYSNMLLYQGPLDLQDSGMRRTLNHNDGQAAARLIRL